MNKRNLLSQMNNKDLKMLAKTNKITLEKGITKESLINLLSSKLTTNMILKQKGGSMTGLQQSIVEDVQEIVKKIVNSEDVINVTEFNPDNPAVYKINMKKEIPDINEVINEYLNSLDFTAYDTIDLQRLIQGFYIHLISALYDNSIVFKYSVHPLYGSNKSKIVKLIILKIIEDIKPANLENIKNLLEKDNETMPIKLHRDNNNITLIYLKDLKDLKQ